MDEEARARLKAAIRRSPYNSQQICEHFEWPPTYVSRVCTGRIKEPAPTRLQSICDLIGVDISYILTGRNAPPNREEFLKDLAGAPDSVIDDVAAFVRSKGLLKS